MAQAHTKANDGPAGTRPALSDDQLRELLPLTKGADSVELKLTVPDSDLFSSVRALRMDPLEAQLRQIVFFDTPDLELNKAGVVVRARRVQGKGDDTVVKLRPVVPSELPAKIRRLPTFGVEVDAMPGGFVCSGSLKGALDAGPVRRTILGSLAVRKLFSKEQRAFYAEHAPEGLELDDLMLLGPILVFKLRLVPKGFPRKLVAELWLYPDGSRLLELSTKCAPPEMFDVLAESRAFLLERGVPLGGEQETKTRKALEYFSASLRERDEALSEVAS